MAATGGLINTCTKLSFGLLTCSTSTHFSSVTGIMSGQGAKVHGHKLKL